MLLSILFLSFLSPSCTSIVLESLSLPKPGDLLTSYNLYHYICDTLVLPKGFD